MCSSDLGYLVGDLNPKAVDLMKRNLQAWTRKQEGGLKPSTVVCRDARTWREDDGLSKQAHVVLVNLPHDSFEHLPDLFDLFVPEGLNLLRGWAIVDRTTVEGRVAQLEALVKQAGGQPSDTTVAEIKGFSTTKCFVVFQTLITWD